MKKYISRVRAYSLEDIGHTDNTAMCMYYYIKPSVYHYQNKLIIWV